MTPQPKPFEQDARRLIEKIFNLKGSNQVNEAQELLRLYLELVYNKGINDGLEEARRVMKEEFQNALSR